MKGKTKLILVVVVSVLVCGTFVKVFDDPFHEKTEKVCFWEWLYKEAYKLIFGEKEATP